MSTLESGGFYNDPRGQRKADMAKKYYDSGMRYEDSMMIREDKSATANLPQGVIMKKYASVPFMNYSELNDTIRVIDNQITKDATGPKIKKGSMTERF